MDTFMQGECMMDAHEEAALEQRYKLLFDQTFEIEKAARHERRKPVQIDPRYPALCRELETVTLQLARNRATAPQTSERVS